MGDYLAGERGGQTMVRGQVGGLVNWAATLIPVNIKQTYESKNYQKNKQTKTDTQTDRHRQTIRQTDRQTNKQKERDEKRLFDMCLFIYNIQGRKRNDSCMEL